MGRFASDAFLVRAVEYGESDLVVTFVTEGGGKVAAMARGARGSARKRLGVLETFHTLHVTLEDKGRELMMLRECRVERVRGALVRSLEAVEAAGAVMRWARHLLPPRTAEPMAWGVLVAALDALDAEGAAPASIQWIQAATALRLLEAVGYGLELGRCIACGRPCPPGRAAAVDAARGGIVCQACGGARRVLSGDERAIAEAMLEGAPPPPQLRQGTAAPLLALAEDAMAAHADFGA